MHALLAILLQAAAPTAGTESQELGLRLARSTGLAVVAPAMIEKDLAELAEEDPSLSADQRKRLLALGRAEARAGWERVVQALGAGYAKRLSISDLKLLVAHAESPVAARWRAAEPLVLAEAATTIGSLDLKKTVATAFCRETEKLCQRD